MVGKKSLIVALGSAIALAACGGGGGGGSSTNDGGTDTGGTAISTQDTVVSGDVNKSTTTTTASKAAQNNNARITIKSFASDGTEVDNVSSVAIDDPNGNEVFSSQVALAEDGGYVVIEVSEDGYTSFSKRVDFDSPSSIDIQAQLEQVQTVSIAPSTVTTASGASYPAYRFAIMRQSDGTTTAVAGADQIQIAKASSLTTEMEVTIPANSKGVDGTKNLDAEVSNFDPSNPEDADNFPGRYMDSDGNRLVSVAFDYTSISQEGENLGERAASDTSTSTAATNPTTVVRRIPDGSCSVVGSLDDADSDSSNGFQIPVYTYNPNTGDWDKLGMGTLEDSSGNRLNTFNESDCTGSAGSYLAVEVTNEDFKRKWWNLDYPLTFSQPVEVCANVQVTNGSGDPVAGTFVQLYDDSTNDVGSGRSFQETYGYTDANGNVTLDSVLLDGSADRSAGLRTWGYGTGTYAEGTVTLSEKSGSSCGATTKVVTVQKADTCSVGGVVVDDTGAAVTDAVVWAAPTDTTPHFATGYTNKNGKYTLDVVCDTPYALWTGYSYLSGGTADFNVDGSVGTDESTDDGDLALMKNVTL
ncbi:MAG: hypothetical protein PVH31_07985, partial [Ectothiorhodospiraceae bacterium]